MKGFSIAEYYPNPAFREFGDVDIYSFNQHEKMNNIFGNLGICIYYSSTHDEFDYEGIHIEYHNNFISIYSNTSSVINDYLTMIVAENPGKLVDGIYYPCADFNAVYLVRLLVKALH